MITISLCMIVRNEAATLGGCLESIADLVEEIIIVDTGSIDHTKEIAERYNAKVYDFQWIDDFSAARNFSFSKATQEYILWLDADDRLLDIDRQRFKDLKQSLEPDIDVVMMPYHAGSDALGHVTLSYCRERLLRREASFRWEEPVHEYIQPAGRIIQSEVTVTHCKTREGKRRRNLEIYQKQLNEGKQLSPRALLYYGVELYENQDYSGAVSYLSEFLNSGRGWVEDNIKACFFLGKSYGALNETENAIRTLLNSFQYDLPRAEHCCELGYLYKFRLDYDRANFWFDLALKLPKPDTNWGFYYHDYWGYIPLIELSVGYYWLGNLDLAIGYNEKAAQLKPDDPSVRSNRQFYQIQQLQRSSLGKSIDEISEMDIIK